MLYRLVQHSDRWVTARGDDPWRSCWPSGAAAFYGSSDFVGALAARRSAVLAVALLAQVTGLALLVVLLPLLGPATVRPADLAAGAAGVFGGLGLLLVYQVLARGPMSIAAPTTALSASAVPVLAGFVVGERPGAARRSVGIASGVRRRSPSSPAERTRRPRLPGRASIESGPARPRRRAPCSACSSSCSTVRAATPACWPLLAARLTSVPVLAALLVARRTPIPRDARLVGPVLVSGVLDMAANVLFLLAAQQGMLAVVAALTGLYPAATVVLAQARLGERMEPVQFAGLGVAVVAAGLVAV